MNEKDLISKVHDSMYRQCRNRGYATAVDILMDTGILLKQKYEDWRLGNIPFLEAVCNANLNKLSLVLRTMRAYAKKQGLKASFTYYKRWGVKKRGKKVTIPLRFSKSGNPELEKQYATHYVDQTRTEELKAARRKEAAKNNSTEDQIRRITHYETILDSLKAALKESHDDADPELLQKIRELDEYYGSDTWKQDFAADEAGTLPADLKRGVLSEDGIYNVLEQWRERREGSLLFGMRL